MKRVLALVLALAGVFLLSTDTAVAVQSGTALAAVSSSPGSLSPRLPSRCELRAGGTPPRPLGGAALASRLQQTLEQIPEDSYQAALVELDPRGETGLEARDLLRWKKVPPGEFLSSHQELALTLGGGGGGEDDSKYRPCQVSAASGSDACYQGFLCATFQCTNSDGSAGGCSQPPPTVQTNPLWFFCPNFTLKTYRCKQGCTPLAAWPLFLGTALAGWLFRRMLS